jgi:alpha-glucosidase (family GH31 glycosyl hydrolase)
MKFGATGVTFFIFLIANSTALCGQPISQKCEISETALGVHVINGDGSIDLEILGPNLLRIDIQPHGRTSPRTLVMDPKLKVSEPAQVSVRRDGDLGQIASSEIQATVTCGSPITISVSDAALNKLVEQVDPFGEAAGHDVNLLHAPNENLYGMSGLSMNDDGGGLIRNNGSKVSAGVQGEAGAPWFFTARYGVLIDSDGGAFDTRAGEVRFSGDSRNDMEYFVMTGAPMQVISTLSTLTGHPPLPPKWTLGFLNSQWGSTEAELKQIAAAYRAKHIPFDAFIMDFDWKAWGDDHYGEWRWNSTSSPGSLSPDQFPDGASGLFSKEMGAEGVHLAGILKPRILLYKPGSNTEMLEAAAYAQAHDLWVPNEKEYTDYATGRLARDLDFSKPETRSWYWQHLEPTFDAGMAGWWNDEADNSNNFQFLNMGRALYDGQRGHSNVRVWSINRNYYLGAQRYGYAEWSGDIQTGFGNMAHQRMRMLATIDTGEPHWSMDTGGFHGHPTPENYARWMEFAAFVPIDRVHGDIGEKRQPWVYGSVAELAATKALRLRYSLFPYIYSYERMATETGVGVVRPLFWLFPDDPKLANEGSSWMFGDALLVSPVVTPGETEHSVYLPAGIWYDYFHGKKFEGGKTINYAIDSETWEDIPLFVRAGSIVASQPPQDYTGQQPVPEITLDVFATAQVARFVYYDDDGATYTYEQGEYYRQSVQASVSGQTIRLSLGKPSGSFHSPLRSYLIHMHGARPVTSVLLNGKQLSRVPASRLDTAVGGTFWASGEDKFGPVTTIRIPAQQASSIELR